MTKIRNLSALNDLREKIKKNNKPGDPYDSHESIIRVKVAIATCSIASGARETMNYLSSELEKRNIDAVVSQTGCMGYCYAEPTVEVTLPESDPVVFGYVDIKKADDIIEKYIKDGMLIDGIIPVNYQKLND